MTAGAPSPSSALLLRRSLEESFATLGTAAADPALGQTVVIGHSHGRLLAKMLVIDPGERLWNGISGRPLDNLRMSLASKARVRAALFVRPLSEVRPAVFIATPHRGSHIAALSVSQLVGRSVTLPVDIALVRRELLANNADEPTFDVRRGWLGSIYGMTPGSSFIRALASVPVVAVNSIIPTRGNGPLADRTDGVVGYSSAHIELVESELVVNSGHSTLSPRRPSRRSAGSCSTISPMRAARRSVATSRW